MERHAMNRWTGSLLLMLPLVASLSCASGPATDVEYVQPAPPPAQVEVVSVSPGPDIYGSVGFTGGRVVPMCGSRVGG